MAIIKPMIRANICINAHPAGCAKETLSQIEWTKKKTQERANKNIANENNSNQNGENQNSPGENAPKVALVLGCSTGYGLASRIVAAFAYNADTIGVSFEKTPTQKKAGTPGFYNNLAFDREAEKCGLKSATFNADAFSDECRAQIIYTLKSWGKKLDLIIYSLASPVRLDPETKVLYKSALKPIGKTYGGPALDMMTGKITYMEAAPAEGDDISNTIKVMGGEDWERWISQLKSAGVLAQGCKTIAYSYIGPALSHPIYRDGTIGEAKKDLESRAKKIDASLKEIGGAAFVSVNKGLITRSSTVIPIICQYLGVLFKVMKKLGNHEGCIEQMERLFSQRLYTKDKIVPTDSEGRIRMDDWELSEEVQNEVEKIMGTVTEENVNETCDLKGIRHDFLAINGFDVSGIDYEKNIDDMSEI